MQLSLPSRRGAEAKDARRWALAALVGSIAVLALGPLADARASGTASLTGTVTAIKGGALEGIEVAASGSGGVGTTTTGPGGKYTIAGGQLGGGSYSVRFSDPARKYAALEASASLTEGTATELNANLQEGGSISGTVTSAATGTGLGGVSVSAFSGEAFEATSTEGNGHYTFQDLPPGTYTVDFSAGSEYISQSAVATVTEGGALNVDAALTQGAKISGRVTDAYSHTGLSKIGVSAFSTTGGSFAATNDNGEYTVSGLPSGSYKIEYFWEFSEAEQKQFENAPRFIPKYITQYFNGQPSAATANTVGATAGNVTSGINVAMVPSAPVNAVPPAISGTSAVGSTLSCSSGSWTGESLNLTVGWPVTAPFGYQWLRSGAAVTGSTASTYVVQPVDVGHGLECEVSATIEAGHASAKSSPFAVVNPVPVVTTSASKLRVSKGATTVIIRCANAACAGSAQLVQTVSVKRHKGKKTITKKAKLVIATGSYSLAAGKTKPITLHLTKGGLKKLASTHRLSPKLLVSVTGGKPLEKTVQVSVAAAKKKK